MRKTALIVDDSKTARVVLQKMLETHDLEVHNAESAESALSYLSENRPDIIFMDHEMPGMDGFEAVSAIKKNPDTATIPIMMYTAQEGELYVGQARALGAVGVLPKAVEPVELSKVLESLRVIGEDAARREHYRKYQDETDDRLDAEPSPALETFDHDLAVLIQELFDQQRSILRRDLRDSHAQIAARVLDEIKTPERQHGRAQAGWLATNYPFMSQVTLATVTVIAVGFAWLYWKADERGEQLAQRNISLERALGDREASAAPGALHAQRQLAEYRRALESAQTVALRGLEWAANQTSQYAFDELPLGDFRLSVIADLANRLAQLDYSGFVRLESHVGNFCMAISATGRYSLPAQDIPASQCDQIGFESSVASELGTRQSVAFANFIDLAEERNGGRIRFDIVSLGNSSPLLAYPAMAEGVSSSDWNRIAAINNRVVISLYPD